MNGLEKFVNETKLIFGKRNNRLTKLDKDIFSAVYYFMEKELKFSTKRITFKTIYDKNEFGYVRFTSDALNKHIFNIDMEFGAGTRFIIGALIHEFTHVQQIVSKKLQYDEKSIIWNNKPYIDMVEFTDIHEFSEKYKKLPWEKEAFKNQETLVDVFLKSKYFNDLYGNDDTNDMILDWIK